MKRILFVLASMLIFQLSKGQNSETAVTIHQEWNSGIFDKMWAFSYEYKNNMSTNEIYNDIVKKINDEKIQGINFLKKYTKWHNVNERMYGIYLNDTIDINNENNRKFGWIYIADKYYMDTTNLNNDNLRLPDMLGKNCMVFEKNYFKKENDRFKYFSTFNQNSYLNEVKKIVKYESQTVLDLLNKAIAQNIISDTNSRNGVSFNSKEEQHGYLFKGVITPQINGVIQIYSDKDPNNFNYRNLKIEYAISNGIISSIKIYQFRAPSTNKSFGDIVIQIGDTVNFKMLDYFTFSTNHQIDLFVNNNSILYRNISVLNNKKLQQILFNLKYIENKCEIQDNHIYCNDWFDLNIKNNCERLFSERYLGNIIKNNRSYEVNDGIANDVLKRKSWNSYINSKNEEIPYNYSKIITTDSTYIIERIEDIDQNKYIERFIIDKMSYVKEIYNNNNWISSSSQHQIYADFKDNSYKSAPKFTVGNPLKITANKIDTSTISVSYFYDEKLLMNGQIDNNDNCKGWFTIYSINANLIKNQYSYQLKDSFTKSLNKWKLCLSGTKNNNQYTGTTYNKLLDINYWNPNWFSSINYSIFINSLPLATSPLGKFDPITKLFTDRTNDFLYQKILFDSNKLSKDYGKMMLLYQYLPNGQIYDSINLYKNEFGEQIGKSVLKPFPYSKDYMALLNKQQNEADEMQIKLMQGMLKELNTCDNCGNTIATGKKITTSEFKCPNGKNYILNSILGKKFCSPKCYSDYQKSWCDMQ
jgi:hypothetical protein